MRDILVATDWSLLNDVDPHEAAQILNDAILAAAEEFVPNEWSGKQSAHTRG